MRTEPLAADPTAPANTPLPRSALQRVVDTGLLRCAVPPALGGTDGTLPDLAAGARHLREHDAEAADILRAQRLAIEALVRSRNVALRELWLPDLLTGILVSGALAYVLLPLWARQSAAAQIQGTQQLGRWLLVGGGAVWWWHRRRAGAVQAPESDAPADPNQLDVGAVVMVQAWQPDGQTRVHYRGSEWLAHRAPGTSEATGPHRIVAVASNHLVLTPVTTP